MFSKFSWSIEDGSQDSRSSSSSSASDCWAILGGNSSGREDLLKVLLGECRCDPSDSIRYPIIEDLNKNLKNQLNPITPKSFFKLVQFKSRLENQTLNQSFKDYTTRYYGLRPENQITLREFLKSDSDQVLSHDRISEVSHQLKLHQFIDLPLITLSNGQSRRASIAHALLSGQDSQNPHALILEEPYTGLDENSRKEINTLLEGLHKVKSPRIILFLRPQDPIPNYVTHLLALSNQSSSSSSHRIIAQGKLADLAKSLPKIIPDSTKPKLTVKKNSPIVFGKELVRMKDVNVQYGNRSVLRNINWTIREGERWALSGPNGSGKSTLLSLILGDHPRSFTEDLHLFGRPRVGQATSQNLPLDNLVQSNIGHVSPEIFHAFPRQSGPTSLTSLDCIITGFESVFSYRSINSSQSNRLKNLLNDFDHPKLLNQEFLNKPFIELSHGEQSLILFLRSLIKEPLLMILDEPFVGMDDESLKRSQDYLNMKLKKGQSLILVSHQFELELPECIDRFVKLRDGEMEFM
ncbi:P-loop containing nucleoside triphosphate hydrolase protein [Melampsora americana]|nr:P-loop containing nucleoside triphosphate hydrolase protein [Melampsora americana]